MTNEIMRSFTGLGIGLSFMFGCILMGIVAELYYLLWWKKRAAKSEIHDFSNLFCWRRLTSFSNGGTNRNPLEQGKEDLEMGKNLGLKGEEGVDLELMRMHNLCGPPRFLFTIKEESKEDMESEDGKSRKGVNPSDVVHGSGTPFSSPSVKSSGFRNPLFESFSEAEVNRLRSSPPPKFKFLKDAEDKLIKKLLLEESERKNKEESAAEEGKDVNSL